MGQVQTFLKGLLKSKGPQLAFIALLAFVILSLFAPWISQHGATAINSQALRLPPFWQDGGSFKFILGTDDLGRDIMGRLLYGGRLSLMAGLGVVCLSLTFGTFAGVTAGYYGGSTDKVIMRLVDILMSLPSILLAIVVVSILGPGLLNAVIAVSIVSLPGFIRIVRAQVMAEKDKAYVQAARTFGASNFRLQWLEIFPNCTAPLIVQSTLALSDGILNTAALGFLGLGARPPAPEWGIMLSDARPYIESAPWSAAFPGLCILVVVLSLNVLGDALRDILDPRLKRSDS